MSFASFAIGSNDVDATSTAASIAVLIISAISTNAIARSSAISSRRETSNASAATSTATAAPKWIRMFRCVRSTWMIPSIAKLKLSKIEGGRRGVITAGARARAPPSPGRARGRGGGAGRGRAASATRRRSPPGRGRRHRARAARPPAAASAPSIGNESTSVGSSIPRCSRLRARISSAPTNAIPSSPSRHALRREHVARERDRAGRRRPRRPLRFATSTSSISGGARSRSPRRAACTPRRSAARACAARRPRARTRRSRCRRATGGCRAPGSAPTPARAGGRSG